MVAWSADGDNREGAGEAEGNISSGVGRGGVGDRGGGEASGAGKEGECGGRMSYIEFMVWHDGCILHIEREDSK